MKYQTRYSAEEHPPAPIVEALLYDPLMEEKTPLVAKLDTGFSGTLLITLNQYLKLGLQLYEEPQKAVSGQLATGIAVPLRASKGIIGIGPQQIHCQVYTTPLLLKPLLGREILNRWRAILDGPRQSLNIELK